MYFIQALKVFTVAVWVFSMKKKKKHNEKEGIVFYSEWETYCVFNENTFGFWKALFPLQNILNSKELTQTAIFMKAKS